MNPNYFSINDCPYTTGRAHIWSLETVTSSYWDHYNEGTMVQYRCVDCHRIDFAAFTKIDGTRIIINEELWKRANSGLARV